MIRFYCGINEKVWNKHPVSPGEYGCVAPVYGNLEEKQKENRVYIPEGTTVIQDSGAFNDGPRTKLSFDDALDRQINHAYKYGYADKVSHIASYDILIDEKWIDGKRIKDRWDEDSAWYAVEETVKAAEFLSSHRMNIPYTKSLILSAQGVSPNQYAECVKQIIPFIDKENDFFGLGGWCITGRKRKQVLPIFKSTMDIVIPILGTMGIKHIHIWGVMLATALGKLLYECDKYGISVSTDSAGPQFYPAFGKWGYADWIDKNYKRPDTDIRGLERKKHVIAVREWLKNFRNTKYYTGE